MFSLYLSHILLPLILVLIVLIKLAPTNKNFLVNSLNKRIGPGSYDLDNGLSKSSRINKPRVEWQQMAVVRLANPPSIPSHNNVFGYEENLDGELVQQPNPDKVFTGAHSDTVGPGQYEVKGMTTRKTGTNWHSSKVSRLMFTETEAKNNKVGPGTYDTIKAIGTSQQKMKGTSSFTSAVPKSTLYIKERPSKLEEDEEYEDPPGPGSYNPKVAAFEQRQFPSSIQQFGATASRFGKSNVLGSNLGPGQYSEVKHYVSSSDKLNRK